jgi:predicted GTPase
MPQDIDLQANAISQGLSKLQNLLEKPVATSALELSKNAAAAREFEVLSRLHKSLLQYIQRNGSLFYIGILGHFSAGKSSTINSLLQSWGTKNERKVDLNPTDTAITLITQEKNGSSLLGVIREGHVTIRLEPVESLLLDEIVLVDTPGTGDPQFIQEMARDFLPICDLILFVFSAASPFDKSDVPLLVELHSRLPFIPIHFVVTRADELRKDSHAPLSEDNLDPKKTEQFVNVVLARVNELLTPQVYLSSSFSLIDTRTEFRIQELRQLIESRCSSSNPQAHVAMHLNKLHFYRSGANSLRIFFSAILERKLVELTKIVDAAQSNIERYQNFVQISNSNLTRTWMEHAANINTTAARCSDALKAMNPLPATYNGFRSVSTKRSEVSQELARSAKYHATSLASSLRATVTGSLQEQTYTLEKTIADTPFAELLVDQHSNLKTPAVSLPSLSETHTVISLYRQGFEVRESEAEALREVATEVRRSIGAIYEEAAQLTPLTEAEKSITSATASLKTDLNQFFQNVELYRSGVFSHTTKESIATLGIGAKLDALETEFTEDDKEGFALDASAELFPGSAELLQQTTNKLLAIARQASEASDEARGIRTERPEGNQAEVSQDLELARVRFATELQAGIQSEIDSFCSNLSVSVGSLIGEAKTKADSAEANLKRARLRRYLTAASLTALVYVCASFIYHHSGAPSPITLAGEAALNISCGVLLEIAVLVIVKARENVPRLLTEARDRIHMKLREEIHELISSRMSSFRIAILTDATLAARLSKIYERTLDLPSTAWKERAKETLESIRKFSSRYVDLRTSILQVTEQVRSEAAQYFADSARNLTVLNQVAAKIRVKAIQPSFDLLAETREELQTVRSDVDAVVFD